MTGTTATTTNCVRVYRTLDTPSYWYVHRLNLAQIISHDCIPFSMYKDGEEQNDRTRRTYLKIIQQNSEFGTTGRQRGRVRVEHYIVMLMRKYVYVIFNKYVLILRIQIAPTGIFYVKNEKFIHTHAHKHSHNTPCC